MGASVGNSFSHRELRVVGKKVFRLGLAANYGIDEAGIRGAFDRGINYVFVTSRGKLARPLRDALKKDRDKIVVAAGPTVGFFGGSVRRSAERTLKSLGVDYIDIFQLMWLGVGSAWTDATMRELEHLRTSGKVRAIGISIHDRARAGKLAESSPLDLFMIRYNAAHPGAERDIFPHLDKRKPQLVAYTATCWRKLLRAPKRLDSSGSVPDRGRLLPVLPELEPARRRRADRPGVDGAARREPSPRLERGPLTAEEDAWMRKLGGVVHGGGEQQAA